VGPFSVYIHYPWCRHRCPYCDFAIAVAPEADIPHERYTQAVLAELEARATDFEGLELSTIYIGGGTPSLWPADELARVLAAVRGRFPGVPIEVTLEANPSDCRPEAMAAWRRAGITRLSIGVQSFHGSDLVVLGRDHRMGEGLAAIEAAMAAGFDSLSIDLILSVPAAQHDPGLERAIALGVPHISTYELTVEPRTPLAQAVARGEVVPLDDDECADRYVAVHERLVAAGYEHYEVSSFALPGHRGKHNGRYWLGLPYLGLGNGAASLCRFADGGAERVTNHRSVGRYLQVGEPGGPSSWADHVERLSPREMHCDAVWLGLRTADGIPLEAVAEVPELVAWLTTAGLAEVVGDRLEPTLRGFLHHEGIARRVAMALG